MKADKIIKNAKIFTSAKNKLNATALAVKDGKFIYVGDDAGISNFEGEVIDLGGKFVMPAIIDSHVHVAMGVIFEYSDPGPFIECTNKKECLSFIADYVKKTPKLKRYRFLLERKKLNEEFLTKEDLDSVCSESEIVILESEGHSVWVNSKVLALHGITDATPDIVPELSYYVRDAAGHVTGNMFEGAEMAILLDNSNELTDEQIENALLRWIDYSVNEGVSVVFDAGTPKADKFHERCYKILCKLDNEGRLPVYVDGSFAIVDPRDIPNAIETVTRYNHEYNTEHFKVHTLKMFMDGTLKIHTAAMVTPYADTNTKCTTLINKYQMKELLIKLNELGWDLHVHTVAEAASRVVLDGVELAKVELGDKFRIKVTCAHLEIQDDADLERFAKLGVIANYTVWWHAGTISGDNYDEYLTLLGDERIKKMYRCKTVWDTGALVTWSSDNISYGDFMTWSPYLGMEVAMTRKITEKTKASAHNRSSKEFPAACEKMNIEEMILGYTINGAKQLGIDSSKGSIEVGKDADYLIFNENLIDTPPEGLSFKKPSEIYFSGKKMN